MNSTDKILSNTRISAYFLGFITFVLIVYILAALRAILIPVTIAVMLTFLFHPLLKYLKKYKIPKWITIIFLFLFLISMNYLLVLIIASNVETFQDKLEIYSSNLSTYIQQLLEPFNFSLRELAEMTGVKTDDFQIGNIFHRLFESGVITNVFNSTISLLGDFFISVIFWVFMIMGKEKFDARLKIAFAERGEIISKNVTNIDEQLQAYIFIKTLISLGTGLVTTIILLIYGIDFAIIWGLLAFILNYIPNIGSLIATIAPILIAFLEFGFGFKTISLGVLLLVTQNVFGNFLEPHYMGRQMDLSPVFVLFSLIFWGWIWGIVGMFLAVPIAAFIKILFSNIEPLKPIAIIMGTKASVNGTLPE